MKIFVPTDLSSGNAAIIKYAYQLCEQDNHELIIFHSFAFAHVATLFSKAEYKVLHQKEYDKNYDKLYNFVSNALGDINKSTIKVTLQLNDGLLVVDDVIEQSKKAKAGLLVVGTHGASGLKKYFLGTNTAFLIKQSKIPVLSLPTGKKLSFKNNFIMGCATTHLPKEWKKVQNITKQIGIEASCVHFSYSPLAQKESANKKIGTHQVVGVEAQIDYSLIENIEDYAAKKRVGGVIMLTNQKRSWFERLFVSSNTAGLSYRNRLPVLSIPAV
ncbi:MAG: universal stress protein [Bacteroidia bacterium]|nr:universal stress protein [Bacteroidia bacterium]